MRHYSSCGIAPDFPSPRLFTHLDIYLKHNWELAWVSEGSLQTKVSKCRKHIACKNIGFSSLFAAEDVSRGGTSATQRQKFHTDDTDTCLHNKSVSHGVPNINLSNFTWLLVDFGKVLCSSAGERQQISNALCREVCIPQTLTVLLEILRIYIWALWPFVFCLSFVNKFPRS